MTVLTLSGVTAAAGNLLAINYSLNISVNTTTTWSFAFDIRVRRNASTIVSDLLFTRAGNTAGLQAFPISDTLVDVAPAAGSPFTYTVTVQFATVSDVTGAFASQNDINVVRYIQ